MHQFTLRRCRLRTLIPILLLGLALLLSGCGGAAMEESTPTPVPTASLPGLVTVQPQMCPVAKLPMLRTAQPQGDMLAWAPDTHTLAYLAPAPGSTWMVGTLSTVSGPAFDALLELADYVAGHLTWSPQGSTLAYLSLRRSDALYSINVVYPHNGEMVDLFPGEAARTDAYSSQKAILAWTNEQTLRVQVSCGLECRQTMKIDLPGGRITLTGEPTGRDWSWWNYRLNAGPGLPAEFPAEYQDFAREVNWAPDGNRLVYVDARRDAWVIVLDAEVQYPLATGGYLSVSETDWSSDGEYLAAQAEDWLFIFGDCP
jgi:hypothetical protein